MSLRASARAGLAAAAIGLLALSATGLQPARAQTAEVQQQDPALRAEIGKVNAYTALMNRTLRAVQSWQRYASWVDMRRGPTGRERYIVYGLYSLYDVSREMAAAKQAMVDPPSRPELDEAAGRYIIAYDTLAPLITRAERYYERQDYRDDGVAEGRELHRQMVPAAEAFLAARAQLEEQMRVVRADLDGRELTDIETREGKSARWQVRNTMIRARAVIDALPEPGQRQVNLAALDEAIAGYSAAIREMDRYKERDPQGLSMFEGQAGSWLGRLREFRQKLGRARGDIRRVGNDATWLVNNYNSLVSIARTAMTMSRVRR